MARVHSPSGGQLRPVPWAGVDTDTVWGVPVSQLAKVAPAAYNEALQRTEATFTVNQMQMAQEGYELERQLVTQEFKLNLARAVAREAKIDKSALGAEVMAQLMGQPGVARFPNMTWLNEEIRSVTIKAFV